MKAKGSFEITMNAEPPYDSADGIMLARASFDKRFSGPLDATSKVNMLSARGPIEGSAGYVAIERVVGTLDGRRGSFVLQHTGVMNRGERSLTITVVPDSGTAALRGISGKMEIEIVNGQHFYEFEYELGAASQP
jgi:hypothetical protein